MPQQADIKELKEQSNYATLTGVELASFNAARSRSEHRVPPRLGTRLTETRRRTTTRAWNARLSPAEAQIREALKKPVEVRFDNRPLKEVLDTLGSMTGVNIFADSGGLASEGVTSDTPVSLQSDAAHFAESALNLILQRFAAGLCHSQ